MAGGIDWFRWHHGSVTDPKFQLVARKAGASLPDVLAVWAYLLERASSAEFRGCFGEIDCEAVDCLFGFDDGVTDAVLGQMVARQLIADEYIVAWEKRQPKREREDDKSTERVRAFRQKQRQEEAGNAMERQETPRGEESREEKKKDSFVPSGDKSAKPTVPCPYQAIVDAYHETLPMLPKVKLLPASRQKAMRTMWGWVLSSTKSDGQRRAETTDDALLWIRGYFGRASANDFLMGRTARSAEHAGWQCDLDFLLTDKGMKQVIERTQDAA